MTSNAQAPRNVIFNGDCIDVMQAFDTGTVDFILTDPPYVTRYRDRQGRKVPVTRQSRHWRLRGSSFSIRSEAKASCLCAEQQRNRVNKERQRSFCYPHSIIRP